MSPSDHCLPDPSWYKAFLFLLGIKTHGLLYGINQLKPSTPLLLPVGSSCPAPPLPANLTHPLESHIVGILQMQSLQCKVGFLEASCMPFGLKNKQQNKTKSQHKKLHLREAISICKRKQKEEMPVLPLSSCYLESLAPPMEMSEVGIQRAPSCWVSKNDV